MLKKLITVAMFMFLIAGISSAYAKDGPKGSKYYPVTEVRDVTIATVWDRTLNDGEGGWFDLNFDMWLPKSHNGDPKPLLIYIHGHGGQYNFPNGSRAYDFSIALANKGIAVASIDYRSSPSFLGLFTPAIIQEDLWDVKAYVRYFRANAKKYNIDPDRFCIWSTSRGGRLGALLATTGDSGNPELEGEVGGNLAYSTALQCAVMYYPMEGVVSEDPPLDLDAVNYIDADDPPVLLAVGGMDTLTPQRIDLELYDTYVDFAVPANLFMWSLGVHGQVGLDIEAYTSEWILNKLLVELAP